MYVIIVVPIVIPVTMPVIEPIVPIEVVPLVHVPPGELSASGIVALTQTAVAPVIGGGSGLTAIMALPAIVCTQPVIVLVATTV